MLSLLSGVLLLFLKCRHIQDKSWYSNYRLGQTVHDIYVIQDDIFQFVFLPPSLLPAAAQHWDAHQSMSFLLSAAPLYTFAYVSVWRTEDYLWKLVLSLPTQILESISGHQAWQQTPLPLGHLTGPGPKFYLLVLGDC